MRFTLPSIIMMFTSIYGVADGFFVSNFVGKIPFAAVNLIMPFLMILGAAGFMFATGGSALIAKTLVEGRDAKAKSMFSLFNIYIYRIGSGYSCVGHNIHSTDILRTGCRRTDDRLVRNIWKNHTWCAADVYTAI